MKRALLISLLTLSLLTEAAAADKDNNFAIKGLAALPCATFVEERNKGSQLYSEALSWLTGFISAVNYLTADTYDLLPWQSPDLLSLLLANHCAANPEESFFHATDKLLGVLMEDRLQSVSDVVTVTVGEQSFSHYRSIINRLQSALIEGGYLKMKWPSGEYDTATVNAMKAFQEEKKLEVNGLPDQQTLFTLFTK